MDTLNTVPPQTLDRYLQLCPDVAGPISSVLYKDNAAGWMIYTHEHHSDFTGARRFELLGVHRDRGRVDPMTLLPLAPPDAVGTLLETLCGQASVEAAIENSTLRHLPAVERVTLALRADAKPLITDRLEKLIAVAEVDDLLGAIDIVTRHGLLDRTRERVWYWLDTTYQGNRLSAHLADRLAPLGDAVATKAWLLTEEIGY